MRWAELKIDKYTRMKANRRAGTPTKYYLWNPMCHYNNEESPGVYEETESREITGVQTRICTVRGWFFMRSFYNKVYFLFY